MVEPFEPVPDCVTVTPPPKVNEPEPEIVEPDPPQYNCTLVGDPSAYPPLARVAPPATVNVPFTVSARPSETG